MQTDLVEVYAHSMNVSISGSGSVEAEMTQFFLEVVVGQCSVLSELEQNAMCCGSS